jgi:hypothetical protein
MQSKPAEAYFKLLFHKSPAEAGKILKIPEEIFSFWAENRTQYVWNTKQE